MAALMVPTTVDETNVDTEFTVPSDVSYFHLNADGTFEDAMCQKASAFIEEGQAGRLKDGDIVRCLRDTFGPFVGVMHRAAPVIRQPPGASTMFVLGEG